MRCSRWSRRDKSQKKDTEARVVLRRQRMRRQDMIFERVDRRQNQSCYRGFWLGRVKVHEMAGPRASLTLADPQAGIDSPLVPHFRLVLSVTCPLRRHTQHVSTHPMCTNDDESDHHLPIVKTVYGVSTLLQSHPPHQNRTIGYLLTS